MTNTELLIEKINKSGLKRSFIAECIGLSAYGLARKINNQSDFKTNEVFKLCELLKIDTLEERDKIFFANK